MFLIIKQASQATIIENKKYSYQFYSFLISQIGNEILYTFVNKISMYLPYLQFISILFSRLILKAPVPLWMPSCKSRGTSHILLGQCSEYFEVRCYLLRGLSFTEQEILGENARTMVEDELTFLQNYVPCPRVEDCTLLAGHLKLVEALVSADGASTATVGKNIIPVILDAYLFPASQVISESCNTEDR